MVYVPLGAGLVARVVATSELFCGASITSTKASKPLPRSSDDDETTRPLSLALVARDMGAL